MKIVEDRELLCFGWKWLGERSIHCKAICDYPRYKPNATEQDKTLVSELRHLLDQADIVVAHNAKAFDVPIIMARFAHYNIQPPAPFRIVDTLLVARQTFGFVSNTLKDLAVFLDCSRKGQTGGIDLWFDCMGGDAGAWRRMQRYNKQDIKTLEEIYLKLRPFDATHPNVTLDSGVSRCCPNCGSSNVQERGWVNLKSWRAKRYHCNDCGRWSKGAREKIKVEVLS